VETGLRGDRRIKLRIELLEGRDERGIVGVEHVVKHSARDARRP
jgi:hypothetical protein